MYPSIEINYSITFSIVHCNGSRNASQNSVLTIASSVRLHEKSVTSYTVIFLTSDYANDVNSAFSFEGQQMH